MPDSGVEVAPRGISGGAPVRVGQPWVTIEGLRTPCVRSPPPDAVLLSCECQRDKVGGLEVARRGCGCKDGAAATEVSIFKAEKIAR